jgi:hypothetical protein
MTKQLTTHQVAVATGLTPVSLIRWVADGVMKPAYLGTGPGNPTRWSPQQAIALAFVAGWRSPQGRGCSLDFAAEMVEAAEKWSEEELREWAAKAPRSLHQEEQDAEWDAHQPPFSDRETAELHECFKRVERVCRMLGWQWSWDAAEQGAGPVVEKAAQVEAKPPVPPGSGRVVEPLKGRSGSKRVVTKR